MAINAKDYLAKLPPARREAVRIRTEELIAEELSLIELRKAHRCSQAELAEKLGIQQSAVSKLERRADMYLSSLRSLVEAMGGTLEIVAKFPNRPPVRINQFKVLNES